MPIGPAILASLADDYLAAELQRRPLAPIASRFPTLSVAEAYRVQRAVVAKKLQRGERLVGRKIGATSEPIQRLLGVDAPVYGHLFAGQQVANGGAMTLSDLIHPRIECEIAFVLGSRLAGPGVTPADVLAATAAVAPALEINDPRTRDWQLDVRDVVADNALAARFVLGTQRVPPAGLDLPAVAVVLRHNGATVAESTGAAVLGDPARAVAWLANALAAHRQSLEPGEIVLPGSLTPIFPVAAGDQIEAIFDHLGRVSVGFT